MAVEEVRKGRRVEADLSVRGLGHISGQHLRDGTR